MQIPFKVRVVDTDAAGIQPTRSIPDDAFVFAAEVSNTRLDSYFTHFDRSSLENFERAAGVGVILLDSHDGRKLGIGYSAGARLVDGEDGQSRLEVLFYIVRGITLGGIHSYATTDDYIKAIEAGIVRDVSVGFTGGRWVCDICGKEYFRGGCPHLLGLEYEIDLGDGPITIKTATVTIFDAELSEVSLVFDGATPGAEIIEKAADLIYAGAVKSDQLLRLETVYRHKFKDPHAGNSGKSASAEGVTMTKQKRETDVEVDETTAETEVEQVDTEIETVESETAETELDETEAAELDETETIEDDTELDETETETVDETEPSEPEPVVDEVDTEADEIMRSAAERNTRLAEAVTGKSGAEALRALVNLVIDQEKEIMRLAPLADMGRAYRADLIEQVIKEGIRARGDDFPIETYKLLLQDADIDHIKSVLGSFRGAASERYPGGRISEDAHDVDDGANGAVKSEPEVPVTAYGV